MVVCPWQTPLAAKWLGKTAARDASLGRTMQVGWWKDSMALFA